MFLIPSGMMLGAPISIAQALLWNLLPVTLGNLFAGTLLTGMALYATYPTQTAPAASKAEVLPTEQNEQQGAFAAAAGVQ
jgi:hypothetical protein